jgi:hypothetical protein
MALKLIVAIPLNWKTLFNGEFLFSVVCHSKPFDVKIVGYHRTVNMLPPSKHSP